MRFFGAPRGAGTCAALLCALRCAHGLVPEAAAADGCRLAELQFAKGTPRSAVELKIAAALARENTYSPYANNLRGGAVVYRDAACELEVVFAPGSPAPWVNVPGGPAEHRPPIEESVLGLTLRRSPAR